MNHVWLRQIWHSQRTYNMNGQDPTSSTKLCSPWFGRQVLTTLSDKNFNTLSALQIFMSIFTTKLEPILSKIRDFGKCPY